MDEPSDAELRDTFLPRLREELAALRSASAETAESRQPVELDQQGVGRLSRMDALQQQAMSAAQDARRQGRGRAIEAAIRRVAAGDFGFCDSCGDFIGLKRLDLDPMIMRRRDCAG